MLSAEEKKSQRLIKKPESDFRDCVGVVAVIIVNDVIVVDVVIATFMTSVLVVTQCRYFPLRSVASGWLVDV